MTQPDPSRSCQRCMEHLKEALEDLSSRHRQLLQAMGVNTHKQIFWETDEKQSKVQIQLFKANNRTESVGFGGGKAPQDDIRMSIECRDCLNIGPEGGARAYVRGPSPLSIVLCSNRLYSSKDFKQVLLHELIHVYDVVIRNWDLQRCEILAMSEIRAAREAECAEERFNVVKRFCVKDRATIATCNMFPDTIGQDCVRKVFEEAMKDQTPFDIHLNNSEVRS